MKIGVSSCLLGQKVRYDGGHQYNDWIFGTLGKFVQFVPVCPEVEIGLGIPREPLRLVGDAASPRLVTVRNGLDCTEKMQHWAAQRLRELEKESLCGFIFKAKSPSSGMERVRVYGAGNSVKKNGVGIFARMFMDYFPRLPVEEDGRLQNLEFRENFIEAIFAQKRWQDLLAGGKSRGRLVHFHTGHKLQIMAHSVKHYRLMGRLVAGEGRDSLGEVLEKYEGLLSEAMRLRPTIKKHVNVLQHLAGYFKKQLSRDEKEELQEIIDRYHRALVPLIVPVTLINHYVRKYGSEYLAGQLYLNPHPMELKLRNHA